MGGVGSGRRDGALRRTIEDYHALDVNDLQRKGYLVPGPIGTLVWTRNGNPDDVIAFRAEDDAFRLAFRDGINEGEWIKETIRIVRVACRYGGKRPYFICPGVVNGAVCERRVVTLHWLGPEFVCSRCGRLSYRSQRENEAFRLLHRAHKIRHRLGHDTRMVAKARRKPKGMWRRNYRRLVDEADGLERLADAAAVSRLVAGGGSEWVSQEVRNACQALMKKHRTSGNRSNQ